MCGRYRLSRRKQLVEEYFDTTGEEEWSPRYNVAPTQPVPVIRQNPKELRRELSMVRWGLIPSWAKDLSGAARMINVRSETAATKSAFKDALRLRRCIIPADGFYQWERSGLAKQPHCFGPASASAHTPQPLPIAFQSRDSQVYSCAARYHWPSALRTRFVSNSSTSWDSLTFVDNAARVAALGSDPFVSGRRLA
jgi:hypothetical protein